MNTPARLFACLILSVALLGHSPAAGAQGFRWWQSDRFKEELSLTDEQIARLEEIFQSLQPTLKTQKDTVETLESKLSKVINDPRSDEAAVLQAAERVETARADLSKSRVLLGFRMRRVLTRDQDVKMKALHEEWVRERRNKSTQPHRKEPGN